MYVLTTQVGGVRASSSCTSDLQTATATLVSAESAPENAFTLQAVSIANRDPEKVNKSVPRVITLELLQTQFSKHMKEAARDLGVGITTLKRICREYGIARWPRRSLKSKQNKAQKKFHKSLTDALKEAQKWQNSENKKIEARSSGTHSSENLHDSSLFSSGDNEVAKGDESVHRPGSTNKGERLELNLKNDGSKLFGNLFTIQTTSAPMISAARMDTEGRVRGSILKGDSDVKTGQRPGLFDSEEQQLFHLAQQRKSVDSLYEHLQVCDVLPLSTKS